MAIQTTHICDRCAKRYEEETDGFCPPGWYEFNAMGGVPEDVPDDFEGPEMIGFLFCDDCSPPVLRDLKSWVPDKS